MKIVFWNTARGSDFNSERFEMILENCIALAYCRPELIVLCELLKTSRKKMRAKGGLPGYSFVWPFKAMGGYTDQNTLRYAILARDDMNCSAFYISTNTDRPALHITINGFTFMAIHAPSVTSTVKPQVAALKWGLATPLKRPAVIFGDLNVDARNSGMRSSMVRRLSSEWNSFFNTTGQLVPKYDRKVYSRPKSGKTLDWALVDPSFTSKVKVSVMATDDSSDDSWDASSDDDFVPRVISTGKSDHEAILIEIG